jgi:hypothetical protein
MENKLTKAVGSTRLWRVQFGVPPNCGGARATVFDRINNGNARSPQVSGATPETARGTRARQHFSSGLGAVVGQKN